VWTEHVRIFEPRLADRANFHAVIGGQAHRRTSSARVGRPFADPPFVRLLTNRGGGKTDGCKLPQFLLCVE
jgi:hypothetical protein